MDRRALKPGQPKSWSSEKVIEAEDVDTLALLNTDKTAEWPDVEAAK